MKATMPYDYAPPRHVNGVLRTCRLVEIGLLHTRGTEGPSEVGADAEILQVAMLRKPTLIERINAAPAGGAIARRAVSVALGLGLLFAMLDIWVLHP